MSHLKTQDSIKSAYDYQNYHDEQYRMMDLERDHDSNFSHSGHSAEEKLSRSHKHIPHYKSEDDRCSSSEGKKSNDESAKEMLEKGGKIDFTQVAKYPTCKHDNYQQEHQMRLENHRVSF